MSLAAIALLFLALGSLDKPPATVFNLSHSHSILAPGLNDTIFINIKDDPDFKFNNNLYWFEDTDLALFGIKNKQGELFIEPMFSQIESFVNGVSIVTFDNLQGAINNQGQIIIPFQYEELQTSSQNRIAFYELGSWGFFDHKGQIVIPATYEFVGPFNEGLALASKGSLFGYINPYGKTIIPFQYDYASNFEDGAAYVQIKAASFTIDKTGKKIAD